MSKRDPIAYLDAKSERWERMKYMWQWMNSPDGIEEAATMLCWVATMMDAKKRETSA